MKKINLSDLQKIQALKQGESLVTSNYIITCKKPLDTYIIEFRKV